MRRQLLFWLISFCLWSHLAAQDDPLTLRLGFTGTGTSDKGLWYFKESQSIPPQEFTFNNSWGVAFDLEYELIKKLSIGVHLNYSPTAFELAIDEGMHTEISEDHTSHNQFLTEIKYRGRPGKAFRPFIGLSAGTLFTRDIKLSVRSENYNFTFINPFIYGVNLGFDHSFSSSGWVIHFIIRGLTFEYTTMETTITNRQTLLDQVWWMNTNHIQVGIGRNI